MRSFYFSIIIGLFFIMNSFAQNENSSELDKIFEEFEFASKLIKTGKGNFTYEWCRLDTLVMDNELKKYVDSNVSIVSHIIAKTYYAFDGDKVYYNQKTTLTSYKGGDYFEDYQQSYNLNEYKLLKYDAPKGTDIFRSKGYRSNNKNYIFSDVYDIREIYLNSITFILNEHKNNSTSKLEIIGDNIYNDMRCKIIRYNSDKETIDVWISESKMYQPVFIKRYYSFKNITTEQEIFQKNYENIWFPKTIILKIYKNINGVNIINNIEKVIINDDFELNANILESQFDIEFPKGISIYDYNKKNSYIMK